MALAYQQSHRLSGAAGALDAAEAALKKYDRHDGEVTLRRSDIVAARAFIVFLRSLDETGTGRQGALMDEAMELVDEAIAAGNLEVSYFELRAFIHYEMSWLPCRNLPQLEKPQWHEDEKKLSSCATRIRPQGIRRHLQGRRCCCERGRDRSYRPLSTACARIVCCENGGRGCRGVQGPPL